MSFHVHWRSSLTLVSAFGLCGLAGAVDVEPAKLSTADAMPVDPGCYEIALGLSWSRCRCTFDHAGGRHDRQGTLTERQFDLGFTAGLVQGLDAGIALGWQHVTDDATDPDRGQGLTDVGLGIKWRFLELEKVALALIPEVSLPVGDGDPADEISTGSNLWGAGLTLAATASMDGLALGAVIGRGWVFGKEEDRGDVRGSVSADVAVGWQVTETIQPEIELHYIRDLHTGDTPDCWLISATVGVLVDSDYGRFGAGIDQALAGRESDEALSIILQWVMGF